jgi:hypothetical protein
VHGGGAGLTTGAALALQSGAAPRALDALGGLTGSPAFATLLTEIYGHQAPAVQSRREGDTLRTELAFPVRDRPGDVGTALKAVLGSATISTLASVSRDRLLAAVGPEARRELTQLSAPPAGAVPPEVAAALADTRGSDGFFYLDLWAAVRPVMTAVRDPQAGAMMGMLSGMPGFATLKLPVVTSYRGGDALTGELRVPLDTLKSAAAVLRPLVGAASP